LFVARSVLLTQVVTSVYIPPRPFLRSRVGRILKRWKVRRYERKVLDQSEITMANADLINVCNTLERDVLSRAGYPEDKLHVFPFGLFSERFAAFDRHSAEIAKQPIVAFIGTFDPRKGMLELPAILAKLVSRIPNVRLRLLGTAGMVPDADSVREYFPRSLWPGLEIHARYDPAELPDLLAGVSAGVFPSRVEGFPFSVLEMLAAGLPVFAYRAPGADMMLSEDFLVRVGDAKEMANRVADLLGNPDRLAAARKCARARAGDFRWEEIAAQTAEIYQRRLARSELV
jgi:glycosyltransferase involved in cell wall biosynthesis